MRKLQLVTVIALLPISAALAQLTGQTNATTPEDLVLVSPETGVDYTPLRNLLAERKWEEANGKTIQLALKAAGREQQGSVSPDDIAKLACGDLETIDKLWKRYSDGHFGLSVQYPIYISTGNRAGSYDVEAYERFGDRVGWRKDGDWIRFYKNLTFALSAPVGHLPRLSYSYNLQGGWLGYTALTKRLVECKVVDASSSN